MARGTGDGRGDLSPRGAKREIAEYSDGLGVEFWQGGECAGCAPTDGAGCIRAVIRMKLLWDARIERVMGGASLWVPSDAT